MVLCPFAMPTRSSRFLCKLLSVCLCVVVFVWLCMCVWLCVCVRLCERERERESSLEIHYTSTNVFWVFFWGEVSRGKGRGLSLVSSAASSTSYSWRQFVIIIYTIHAADPSEK